MLGVTCDGLASHPWGVAMGSNAPSRFMLVRPNQGYSRADVLARKYDVGKWLSCSNIRLEKSRMRKLTRQWRQVLAG